jgi:hypothetical protein
LLTSADHHSFVSSCKKTKIDSRYPHLPFKATIGCVQLCSGESAVNRYGWELMTEGNTVSLATHLYLHFLTPFCFLVALMPRDMKCLLECQVRPSDFSPVPTNRASKSCVRLWLVAKRQIYCTVFNYNSLTRSSETLKIVYCVVMIPCLEW